MKYMKPANLFQELLKPNALKRNRLLGLDVGDKYVGLAVSDVHNKIASPLSVLLRKKDNIDLMASDFQLLISQLSLTGFVVGYPFPRELKSSSDAVQVKLFIDDLCETGKLEGVSYTFWNECFTSKNVEFLLKPLNLHPVQSKTVIDKFAAVGILQQSVKQEKKELDEKAAAAVKQKEVSGKIKNTVEGAIISTATKDADDGKGVIKDADDGKGVIKEADDLLVFARAVHHTDSSLH